MIQCLDQSLQQVSVEGEDLEHALADWKPTLRHSGAYVAPRFFNIRRPEHRPDSIVQAHNFGLVVPSDDTPHHLKDGDKVTLPQGYYTTDSRNPVQYPSTFTARAMVARSITHLTLRLYVFTDSQCWNDVD